jgi:hypothetical protein
MREEVYKNLREQIIRKEFSISENDFLNSYPDITNEEKDILLRKIFDFSRIFGLEVLKSEKGVLSFEKVVEIIKSLNIGCISGNWEKSQEEDSVTIKRKTCPYNADKELICLYWREALDGLVMGLGDTERYSRHKSLKYGLNDSCVDVIYDSSKIDLSKDKVPAEILKCLEKKEAKLAEKGIKVIPIGFNERTFFYTLKDLNTEISPFRRKYLRESLEKSLEKKFPFIELVEMSPRAVIEGEF